MKEVRKIIFYSCGNNGDIHYSRNFVKHISQNIPVFCEYQMNCSPSILKDIKMPFSSFGTNSIYQNEMIYEEEEKTLWINTWVGSSNAKFILNEVGCSLTANIEKYKPIYEILNIQMLEPKDYVPDINWNSCDTSEIDDFILNKKLNKLVLVSNGLVLSGQSHNIDLNPVVEKLADSNPNVSFVLTNNQSKILKPNVSYTSDIIKTNGSDLNEIGYFGTKADIIVGRASGPFCFCHNKTALFDPSKTFLAITNYKTDGWWALPHQLPENQAKQLWTNKFDNDSIYDIIQEELNT